MKIQLQRSGLALIAALLPALCQSQQQEAPESEPIATLSEVVVTGIQPGPGLWRVTKGDHTLWILGIYLPLPKNIDWQSERVEAVIAESQLAIGASGAEFHFDVSFLERLKAAPANSRSKKNVEGELKDSLPPDVYARWNEMKVKYLGRGNRWNKLRPTFAAMELETEAIEDVGLSRKSKMVTDIVEKAARKRGVRLEPAYYRMNIKIKQLNKLFDNVEKLQLHDRECFETTVLNLERNLGTMIASANAWATGDIAKLKQLNQGPVVQSCGQVLEAAMLSAGDLNEKNSAQRFISDINRSLERGRAASQQRWLSLAENSLKSNKTTFAMLVMRDLVRPDGLLAKLKAKGYEVHEPE